MSRITKRITAWVTVAVCGTLTACTVPGLTAVPRGCPIAVSTHGHTHWDTLPSGDAARFAPGDTRVCTNGTWVRVTGYGTAR